MSSTHFCILLAWWCRSRVLAWMAVTVGTWRGSEWLKINDISHLPFDWRLRWALTCNHRWKALFSRHCARAVQGTATLLVAPSREHVPSARQGKISATVGGNTLAIALNMALSCCGWTLWTKGWNMSEALFALASFFLKTMFIHAAAAGSVRHVWAPQQETRGANCWIVV